MAFKLSFSAESREKLMKLECDSHSTKSFKAIRKALAYLANNPKHPSLNTHKHKSFSKKLGKRALRLMQKITALEHIGYFGIMDQQKIRSL